MNLNWSNRVIKYVLFVFNLLFVISAIVMIAVGVSVKTYYTDYDIVLDNSYFSLPNLLIATGSLIFFISFFGCCGAVKESWFMIFIFSVLLILIFILEFSAGIAGYVLRDKTTSYITDALTESMKHYKAIVFIPATTTTTTTTTTTPKPNDNDTGENVVTPTLPADTTTVPSENITNATTVQGTGGDTENKRVKRDASLETSTTTLWDEMQPEFKCCGVEGPEDWKTVLGNDLLPASCCYTHSGIVGQSTCSMSINSTSSFFKTGCVTGFGDYLKEHAVTLGAVGLAIAFIQLFGIIFACHLTRQLKHGFYST